MAVKRDLKNYSRWCTQFNKWVAQAYPKATKPMIKSIKAHMKKHLQDPLLWKPENHIESAWAQVWEPFPGKPTQHCAASEQAHRLATLQQMQASKASLPQASLPQARVLQFQASAPIPQVNLPQNSQVVLFRGPSAPANLRANLLTTPLTVDTSRTGSHPLPPRPSVAAISISSQPTQPIQQEQLFIPSHTTTSVSAMAPIRLRGQQEPVFNHQHVSLLRLPI